MPKKSKPPQPVERRGYNVAEWCEAYRRSRDTAYKLMREGRLPYVVLGGRRLIPFDDAENLIKTE